MRVMHVAKPISVSHDVSGLCQQREDWVVARIPPMSAMSVSARPCARCAERSGHAESSKYKRTARFPGVNSWRGACATRSNTQ